MVVSRKSPWLCFSVQSALWAMRKGKKKTEERQWHTTSVPHFDIRSLKKKKNERRKQVNNKKTATETCKTKTATQQDRCGNLKRKTILGNGSNNDNKWVKNGLLFFWGVAVNVISIDQKKKRQQQKQWRVQSTTGREKKVKSKSEKKKKK